MLILTVYDPPRACVIMTRSGAARREDSSGGVDVWPHGPPPPAPAREELADEQAALRSMATLVAPSVPPGEILLGSARSAVGC